MTKEIGKTLDPATFAVLVARVDSIMRATVEVLFRTARSILLAECRDATSYLLTKDCRVVSIAEGLPIHCAAGDMAVSAVANAFDGDIHQGDLFIFNHPYMGNTHVGDINIMAPVFFKGEHLFWMANRSHLPDIGAVEPASLSLYFKDKWAEGIHIPPLRIHRGYKELKDVLSLFKANFRGPKTWYGDHLAQVACVRTGESRLAELCEKYSVDVVNEFCEEFQAYADRLMTEEIRKLPKGSWEAEERHDPVKGIAPEGVRVAVKMSIDPEEAIITLDLSKSDDQINGGINTTKAGATAALNAAVMQCLNPAIPKIYGALKHIHVVVREGSCAGGPIFPIGTSCATTSLPDRLANALFACFAQAAPERAHGSAAYMTVPGLAGVDFRKGNRPYMDIYYLSNPGGPSSKGYDGWPSYMCNCCSGTTGVSSAEIVELKHPHIHKKVEAICDSGGPGQWRGGVGGGHILQGRKTRVQHICLGDGQVNPPRGILGGKDGRLARQWIADCSSGDLVQEVPSAGHFVLEEGHEWHYECGGGGGYGDPFDRDPELVRWDAREGLISLESARDDYGVVLNTEPECYEVDYEATKKLRQELKKTK